MSNKVQIQNGRIVIHDPRWYQSGANLPAVRQQQQIAPTDHDRRMANIRSGNTLYVGGTPHQRLVGLKLVETDSQASRFYSTYIPAYGAPDEYHIGRMYSQPAQPDHGGGYYLYATDNPLQLVNAFNRGLLINDVAPGGWYGILRCEGYGPYVAYDEHGRTIPYGQWNRTKKLACSTLITIEFVGHWQV